MKLWTSDRMSLVSAKTHFVGFFAFSIEGQRLILLKGFLFHVLNVLVGKQMILGVDFGINSIFLSLVLPDISGTSGDMSWLQGGRFMAVSGFSHVRESKQYYRTQWSTDYLLQGHIDPSIVFCYHFYFLWAFFRCDLDYKMLLVHSPSGSWLSSWGLHWGGSWLHWLKD